jgi:AhpD family alkylhydroperoxidase
MEKNVEVTGDNTPRVVELAIGQATDGQRTGVYKDIEQTFGAVPGFFKMLPPTHLAGEWRIFKEFQLSDQTALEPKVKELIGLAVAAAIHCKYCTYFHTVAAGLAGASPEELNEALLMTKHTAGWSAYLTGARYDLEQLKREMETLKRHVAKQHPQRS